VTTFLYIIYQPGSTGYEDEWKKTQGQTMNMVVRPSQERQRKKRMILGMVEEMQDRQTEIAGDSFAKVNPRVKMTYKRRRYTNLIEQISDSLNYFTCPHAQFLMAYVHCNVHYNVSSNFNTRLCFANTHIPPPHIDVLVRKGSVLLCFPKI
jgi:hypothetical protein